MEVSRQELEDALEELRGRVSDRLAGIHGPGTLAWEHGGEVANFIGSGRAVLMQIAHAPVASAIADHSKTFSDLRGRFERTFSIVFSMTFGDLDAAILSARRLHTIHSHIRGTTADGKSYAANNRDSLRWVYATLIDSIFAVRRACGDAFPPAICELYYRETKRFALLFGLRDDDLPRTYADFRAYVDECAAGETARVTELAREMSGVLLSAPHPLLTPLERSFRDLTASLLPEPIARGFGLDSGESVKRRGRRIARLAYRVLRASPDQVRFFPEYLDALARVGVRSGAIRRVDRVSKELVIPRFRSALLRASA